MPGGPPAAGAWGRVPGPCAADGEGSRATASHPLSSGVLREGGAVTERDGRGPGSRSPGAAAPGHTVRRADKGPAESPLRVPTAPPGSALSAPGPLRSRRRGAQRLRLRPATGFSARGGGKGRGKRRVRSGLWVLCPAAAPPTVEPDPCKRERERGGSKPGYIGPRTQAGRTYSSTPERCPWEPSGPDWHCRLALVLLTYCPTFFGKGKSPLFPLVALGSHLSFLVETCLPQCRHDRTHIGGYLFDPRHPKWFSEHRTKSKPPGAGAVVQR